MEELKKAALKHAKSTMTELKLPQIGNLHQSTIIGSTQKSQVVPRIPKQSSVLNQIYRSILSILPHIGCAASLYLILLTLSYNGIMDPCSIKVSYYRHCQKDAYLVNDMLSYTEYKEDSICLMPGVFYHSEEKGWNLGIEC